MSDTKLINKKRKNEWLEIWKEKGQKLNSTDLNDIIKANGFDTTLGKFNSENWYVYIKKNLKGVRLKKNSTILEYGCGAGAFLSFWYEEDYNLNGIDYSKSLINKGRKIFPKINFKVGEKSAINKFNLKFDIIFAHSVFHYFDNYKYAKNLIFNMILNLKDDGKILILDIPDRAKEKFYKRNVEKAMGKINYKKKYSSHSHLFYEKNFFKKLAKEYKLKIKIYNQDFKKYSNSRYRYNVVVSK